MKNIANFFSEAWSELRQVAWITTPQMIQSTWLVVFLVILMATFLFFVDKILQRLFKLVY